eukprot:m.892460 g.892460  ORF g.892460 m.892460 type:complete len:201 (+) comp23656_c1_seq9:2167-2769(+)
MNTRLHSLRITAACMRYGSFYVNDLSRRPCLGVTGSLALWMFYFLVVQCIVRTLLPGHRFQHRKCTDHPNERLRKRSDCCTLQSIHHAFVLRGKCRERRRVRIVLAQGTFNLDWSVGDGSIAAYGHVGDTYGYQSQTTYFPSHDFVLTVATNVETNTQKQPAQFTCLAFNEILAALEGKNAPTCEFIVPHHFIGTCNCTY